MTAAISQYLYDPGNVIWLVIYIEILILDLLYVFLLSKAPAVPTRRRGGLNRVVTLVWLATRRASRRRSRDSTTA